jgi:glutamine synthetase
MMSSYLAGLIQLMPELMVMVCPTVNSYKRTVPGTWAPVNASWGIENRTAAIRAIPGSKKATRIEFRLPGADSNPYLAMAASLAAGLHGVERSLQPPPSCAENAYETASAAPLPRTLAEATARFKASACMRELLGSEFVEHYAATREWEVRQFDTAVTDWELDRYFEVT